MALASCNHGTEEASVPRIVRNLYRLYVDTYKCMGAKPDDDGVPVVMGFLPTAVNNPKEDRPVMLFAGSLTCLNSKLALFCNSSANANEKVCQMYKQVYLNDASLLFSRILWNAEGCCDSNYHRALSRRAGQYTRQRFDHDLIELQDAYIEFLQTTIIGMLLESNTDLNDVPLHLLEPRELEVSLFEEDDNVVGNDYLTPRTREILKEMDFSGESNLTRTQLAILSLIPPNNRILGTYRLNQSTEVIDLEHAKKKIQKDTIDSNKKAWQKYSEALISAAFAQRLLEVDGPIDFGFDLSSIQDPMDVRWSSSMLKDPLKEAENIKDKMTTTHAQSSSSLSQNLRAEVLRKDTGPNSVLAINSEEMQRALEAIVARVERDYARQNGMVSKAKCLQSLRIRA